MTVLTSQDSYDPSEGASKYRELVEHQVDELWQKDVQWKLGARSKLAWFFCILLIVQNLGLIAGIVVLIAKAGIGNLADIASFLAVIIAATLTETAVVIKIIISWLFTDIAYGSHPLLGAHAGRALLERRK